ncbi:unnamed protein product [Nippostrongylus brasiliensis]|uniref:Ion transport domain-containing protein n=1 Tax=Nippostrongylus brasiliensis TaxID=27835 RepID=A0A3P7BM65_NIPBR|nr:unnamed protein product [Nippostrongylus brasiliensis]
MWLPFLTTSSPKRSQSFRSFHFRQISETFKSGYNYGLNAASALRPENLKQTLKNISGKVRQMTWMQLLWAIGLLIFHCAKTLGYCGYLFIMTLFRFAYYLTAPERHEEEETKPIIKEPHSGALYGHPILPEFHHSHVGLDAFGVAADQLPTQNNLDVNAPQVEEVNETTREEPTPATAIPHLPTPPPSVQRAASIYESIGAPVVISASEVDPNALLYEPKIAEQNVPEKAEVEDDDDITTETVFITGMTVPYVEYELTGWVLAQVLYWISVLHLSTSFALLVSFYQLKIPLITFKREKEVARRLMFDGCWITEDDNEESGFIDTLLWYLDRIVISSKSFPMMYWDKFVRRKTRQKFKEQVESLGPQRGSDGLDFWYCKRFYAAEKYNFLFQVDEEILTSILGEEKSSGDNSFDYRYTCWLWIGVILTNGQFLYRVGYLLCSACGVFISPFFYAFHLIDVVLSFPMLKAILQSVTHNLQQLILTIMMTLVVVYLYTVIAFNFFRKFYVQEGEDGEEPDRKCHNMLTCFIYHFYAGVRAGGGIGDELESPYGDELEYPRMFYDISFFFFVIIILLAIMQGLIIDAFGELRDQQESATEKLESSCFICDIGKETFDRMPRGFEIHTTKEHNFANYLFFLQHLVNKDETEYTGQETYVREKYDNRDWDFFPVGECFVKQYEDQLLQS